MRLSQVLLLASSICLGVPAPAFSTSPLITPPYWTGAVNDWPYAHFGHSVASAGDFDGDGYDDVVVAAPYYNHGFVEEGRVSVHFGDPVEITDQWNAFGGADDVRLGYWGAAGAGDVNGDGYDDLLAVTTASDGAVFLWYGSPDRQRPEGSPANADWAVYGDPATRWVRAASAGDVNADGYADVIVGAPNYPGGPPYRGRVCVYHGSPTGLGSSPAWVVDGADNEHFGRMFSGAGDVNGDGYADVIVGSEYWDNYPQSPDGAGRCVAFHGSASGLSTVPNWTIEGDVSNAGLGRSVAPAGDVNGDTYSDVVVSRFHESYIYLGSSSGLATTPVWSASGSGFSFASTAGDVNGDGLSDILGGYGSVYLSSSLGVGLLAAWTPDRSSAEAAAGDVDGDGLDDVLTGCGGCDTDVRYGGKAFLYRGSVSPLGHIAGSVFIDGAPAAGITVDFSRDGIPIGSLTTDGNGTFLAINLPEGEVQVSVDDVPVGFEAVAPSNGAAEVPVFEDQTTTQDFSLQAVQGGSVRGSGYWKHQAHVHLSGHGQADESLEDMVAYSGLIRDHFYFNSQNPIRSWYGWGCIPGDEHCYLSVMENMYFTFTANGWGSTMGQRATKELLAVLLNVVSNRLHTNDVVSSDGATASQAIQHIDALILDGDDTNDELAKDIAETMNKGRMLDAGIIDLSRPTIYYARPMPLAPAVIGPVRVAPNPMTSVSTVDFEMPTAGRAEVRIFDINGRMVRTLLDRDLPTGRHSVVWDGTSEVGDPVANGVYFYRVERPDGPLTARVVVTGEMR